MKVLTANRLSDGDAVWYSAALGWSQKIANADIASDADAEARLAAIGAASYANNEVIDVNIIDVANENGRLVAVKLRERIRADGPTVNYAGKSG